MPDAPLIHVPAVEHPMVIASMARMARSGAWQRLLEGEPLHARIDLIDARFLVAAGVLRDLVEGRYAIALTDPIYSDPSALAGHGQSTLRRALRHADGGGIGWEGASPELILAQGRATAVAADLITETILPAHPNVQTIFTSGEPVFLDVGIGVAAISIALARRFPRLNAVGIDVLPDVLAIARDELRSNQLTDRIELRQQSVADLDDPERYTLAWVGQPFIPPDAFATGVHRVLSALTPGGAIVIPLATPTPSADAFTHAAFEHTASLLGGGPITTERATTLLQTAGYTDTHLHQITGQSVISATKPPA